MKIGVDYWQVLSHYPEYFCELIRMHMNHSHDISIVSAVGKSRAGTVEAAVRKILEDNKMGSYRPEVHEVVFDNPSQSPELKLAKCQELGIEVFFDDRDDVCRLLNKHGILSLRVTRRDNSTYDLDAEIKPEPKSGKYDRILVKDQWRYRRMKIGVDYWQVLSHYPEYFCELIRMHMNHGHDISIISAVGKNRAGTVEAEVRKILEAHGIGAYKPVVHEVVFESPSQSPMLKLAKCQQLGIEAFFDDRDDVCRLLNQHGILALRVTRKDNSTYDLDAEIKPDSKSGEYDRILVKDQWRYRLDKAFVRRDDVPREVIEQLESGAEVVFHKGGTTT